MTIKRVLAGLSALLVSGAAIYLAQYGVPQPATRWALHRAIPDAIDGGANATAAVLWKPEHALQAMAQASKDEARAVHLENARLRVRLGLLERHEALERAYWRALTAEGLTARCEAVPTR